MATATATEMAPLLVAVTLIDGVMVVVFCRGVARSIFLWSQNFFLGSKKIRERNSEKPSEEQVLF
jgi:hypothetical protein